MAAIAAEAAGRDEVVRLEAATLSAWPAIKTAHDGRWLWRYSRGLSKRTNSIQCLDPEDDQDAEARLRRMVELSLAHRLPPLVRVTPLAGRGLVAALDAGGWEAFEESRVLAMPMPGSDFEVAHRVRQYNIADADWYRAQSELAGYLPGTVEILKQMLLLVPHEARGMLAFGPDGLPTAAAMVVNASGIAVFLNVVADPGQRGRGHGRAVMHAASNWAREDGATIAALQVISTNSVALNLYASMGFVERYRYHYRREPQ